MRRIAVVITARPSYARVKSVLTAIEAKPGLELQLVLTGSALLERYGRVEEVILKDGFKPAARAHIVIEGGSPLVSAKTVGLGISELGSIFDNLKPDCVLTVADRYETLATATAGAYLNIPVAHIQGGEISGNIDEKVRHAVTKLADLHFVANTRAYERLVAMGERTKRVWVTGCPSIDLAQSVFDRADDPHLLLEGGEWCATGLGHAVNPFSHEGYIIVMQHPDTYEWEQAGAQMNETLQAVHELGVPCFWFWPNVDAGADLGAKAIRVFHEKTPQARIRFLRNMPPEPFLWLLGNCRAIVGNSSVAIREGSYYGIPAVNIGSRQSGRDMGPNVVNVMPERVTIRNAIEEQMQRHFSGSDLYGSGNAGLTIADLLLEEPLTTRKRFHERPHRDPRSGWQQEAAGKEYTSILR